MSDYIPRTKSSNVAERPLDRGIIRDVTANQMPIGSVWTAENFMVGLKGLTRRPGITALYPTTVEVPYPPLMDIITLWQTDGSRSTILVDTKFIYTFSSGGVIPHYDTYAAGSCLYSNGYLYAKGVAHWPNSNIKSGDMVILYSGVANEVVAVKTWVSSTALLLSGALTGLYHSASAYAIRKAFHLNGVDRFVDWTISFEGTTNKIIFADGSRTLRAYDGSTFGPFDTAATYIPQCVLYNDNRLFMADVTENSLNYAQRIRWSTRLNHKTFSALQFNDLPYSSDRIVRLMPLGDMVVAFLKSSIWYGRKTSVADDSLPYDWKLYESGGIGLVGVKAVASYLDSLFFVGKNGIYTISLSSGLQPLSSKAVSDEIAKCTRLWKVWAANDTANNRIVFGFPQDTDDMVKLWSYNYVTQSWSYDLLGSGATCLSRQPILEVVTYDSVPGGITYTAPGAYGVPYNEISGAIAEDKLWLGSEGLLKYYTLAAAEDYGPQAIQATIETRDMDFTLHDDDKTVLRWTIHLSEVTRTSLRFFIYGSNNGGYTWRNLGSLYVRAGTAEGKADFKITGSILRFKLVHSQNIVPFTISEFGYKIIVRGTEVNQNLI